MKNFLLLLIPILAILFRCTTEDLKPVADFTFRNEKASTFAIATYDTCSLFNRSQNVQLVSWNLGDGRISNDENVILSYEKSGTYEVTLTITGKGGQETTVSKTVIVKDRVLRSIEISSVYWKENTNGWPPTSKADIYLQIQAFTDTAMTKEYLCLNCPVLYTSAVVHDVKSVTNTPITIPIAEKFIIDRNRVKFAWPDNLNSAYLISIIAKDENGKLYCLENNTTGSFGIVRERFEEDEFIVQGGYFAQYRLMCNFE